jgi:hypothetical protein
MQFVRIVMTKIIPIDYCHDCVRTAVVSRTENITWPFEEMQTVAFLEFDLKKCILNSCRTAHAVGENFLRTGSFIMLWRRHLDLLSSLVFVVFDPRIVLKFCYWLKQWNKSPLPLFCTGPAVSFYFWCCNKINAAPHLCGLRGGVCF